MKSNHKPGFHFRDVLLSTGEYTKEAVINRGGSEIFESSPLGLTLGLNEASLLTRDNKGDYSILESQGIFSLNQESFDINIASKFNSQVGTALSMVFLRYLALESGFSESELYKFISKTYNKKGPFPKVIFNILNGGKHAGNGLDFCEFMIIPHGSDIQDCIRIASEVYLDLKNLLEKRFGKKHTLVGREGGFSPDISNVELAIDLIRQAIDTRNHTRCDIAIDVAANNFGRSGRNKAGVFEYRLDGNVHTTDSLVGFYQNLIAKFPEISYLEDPFHEEDLYGWKRLNLIFERKIDIVADDLTVTNISYLEKYKGCFNSCILKINQVGSLTGLITAYNFCVQNNINTIISQRSGETDSDIIVHLSLGLGSDYLKAGAPARERIIKYNTLIRLWDRVHKDL